MVSRIGGRRHGQSPTRPQVCTSRGIEMTGQTSLRRTGEAQNARATNKLMSRADKRELVGLLSGYDMFRRCTTADLEALVEAGGHFAIPAGWPLMLETTPADSCYAITQGTAHVFRDRVHIATLGTGSIVGEMAVLTGELRRATVTSVTALRGLRVDNDALMALWQRRPQLLATLQGAYDERVAQSKPSARDSMRAAFNGRVLPQLG